MGTIRLRDCLIKRGCKMKEGGKKHETIGS